MIKQFFLSLENYSKKIRWSLDLRWQDPNKPNGFWGMKDTITMRKASEPNYKVDWNKFASEDRTQIQHDRMVEMGKVKARGRRGEGRIYLTCSRSSDEIRSSRRSLRFNNHGPVDEPVGADEPQQTHIRVHVPRK